MHAHGAIHLIHSTDSQPRKMHFKPSRAFPLIFNMEYFIFVMRILALCGIYGIYVI